MRFDGNLFIPDEIEVHPAIGRFAFIVRPDGVRLHRLTNGSFEQSGLAPDNEEMLEKSLKTIDLKLNDWNQFRLNVKGDAVTLEVNGSSGRI